MANEAAKTKEKPERWATRQRNHCDEMFFKFDQDRNTGFSYHRHDQSNDYLKQLYHNDPVFQKCSKSTFNKNIRSYAEQYREGLLRGGMRRQAYVRNKDDDVVIPDDDEDEDEDDEDHDKAALPPAAPAPFPESESATALQAAVLLPPARERKVAPIRKDIDCGDLNQGLAQLTTEAPNHQQFQIMMYLQYNWIEGKDPALIQQDYTTVVDNQLDRTTVDIMLPGPTTHDQVQASVIQDGMAILFKYRPSPCWTDSYRVATLVPGFTGMDNRTLIASRTTGHQAGIRSLIHKHDGSIEYEMTIPLTRRCENSFTDRNDFGVRERGPSQAITIGTYQHGKEIFGPNGPMGQQLCFILHLQLIPKTNHKAPIMSPQSFVHGPRQGAGYGPPPPPGGYHPYPPPSYWGGAPPGGGGGGGGYPLGGYPPQPQPHHQPYPPPPPHAYGGPQGPYGYPPPAPAQGGAPQAPPGAPPPYGGHPGLQGAGAPQPPPPPLGLAPTGTVAPPVPPAPLAPPVPPVPPAPLAPPLGLTPALTPAGTGAGASKNPPPPPPRHASTSGLGSLASGVRGFFNTTPRNTNTSASATTESFMPTFDQYDTVPNDTVNDVNTGATVVTDAANTTTSAQQTGRDSRRRPNTRRGSRSPGRRTRSSTGGNLKSPSKYN